MFQNEDLATFGKTPRKILKINKTKNLQVSDLARILSLV